MASTVTGATVGMPSLTSPENTSNAVTQWQRVQETGQVPSGALCEADCSMEHGSAWTNSTTPLKAKMRSPTNANRAKRVTDAVIAHLTAGLGNTLCMMVNVWL